MKRLIEIYKRVTTKFNLYFIVVAFIILFLFVMAIVFNDTKVYLLLFFVFAITLINSYFARENLFYLNLSIVPKGRFFAQTQNKLLLSISNSSYKPSYGVEIDGIEISKIAPKSKKDVALVFTPKQRGKIQVEEYILSSTYPLPHLNAFKSCDIVETIVVYPKPEGKNLEDSFSLHSLSQYGNEEFESIKDYVEGESMSKIHWPSFAKQEKFMSKQFSGENKMLELELNYIYAGKTHEEKLSQLCLWILQCEQKELPFSLILQNETLHSSNKDIDSMLERLSLE